MFSKQLWRILPWGGWAGSSFFPGFVFVGF